ATGVEAEPTKPEQAGAEHRHRQVVWVHFLITEAEAAAEDDGGDQRRETGADVNNRASREVERTNAAERAQPAALAPDPVGQRVIDEGRPEQREDDEGLEALALGE